MPGRSVSLLLSALIAVAALLPVAGRAEPARGKKYALLVGVKRYDGNAFRTLKYPENDVEELAGILTDKKAGFDSVRVLTGARGKKKKQDAPTAANVQKALDELMANKGPNDVVLIALSGHGTAAVVRDPDREGKPKTFPFFCPSDADLARINYSTGRSKDLVNLNDLLDDLQTCGAGSKLLLIDACRNEVKGKSSAHVLDAVRTTQSATEEIKRQILRYQAQNPFLAPGPGRVGALFSCSQGEFAWEDDELRHGVFFHFVLEGLRGKAATKDGSVTWPSLTEYVTKRVSADVGKIVGGGARQTPHEIRGLRVASPVLVDTRKKRPRGRGRRSSFAGSWAAESPSVPGVCTPGT